MRLIETHGPQLASYFIIPIILYVSATSLHHHTSLHSMPQRTPINIYTYTRPSGTRPETNRCIRRRTTRDAMQFTDSIVRKPNRLRPRVSQSDRLFHQLPDVGRQCGRGADPTAPARTRSDPVEPSNLPCKRRHAYATINQYRSPKPGPYGRPVGYIARGTTHCSFDAPSVGAAAAANYRLASRALQSELGKSVAVDARHHTLDDSSRPNDTATRSAEASGRLYARLSNAILYTITAYSINISGSQ